MNRLIHIKNGNRSRTSPIKVVHWNAGSSLWENKLLEIEILLLEKSPDLCFITEANLWESLPDWDRQLPGYYLIYPNTFTELKHVRIVLLVKNNMNIHILNDHMDNDIASIWIRIGTSKKTSVIIGGLYREHSQLGKDTNLSSKEKLKLQERRWDRILARWKALGDSGRCFVIGDLNLDFLRWDSPDQHHAYMVDSTKNIIEVSGFIQLITSVTRAWSMQADSLLDHIWTNSADRVIKHGNEVRASSDHHVISVEIAMKELKTGGQNVVKRLWKNFKKEDFLQDVKNTDWDSIMLLTNVDVANSQFEEKFCHILDKHAPMSTCQIRTKFNNWITHDTKMEMESRNIAWMKARTTGSTEDWDHYKKCRNLCTKKQKIDKSNYLNNIYTELETETNTAKLFGKTRELLGQIKAGPPTCFLIKGKPIRKQQDLANHQAQYYFDKIQNIKKNLPQVRHDPLQALRKLFNRWVPKGVRPQYTLQQIKLKDTILMIKNLKTSHASGRDKIDPTAVKIAGLILAPVITHIINLSLGTYYFPQKWKLGKVLPLLKSTDADKLTPNSFRPITQLPLISKFTERAMQIQLLKYLEEQNMISVNHHAFRAQHSTTTALIQLCDAIAEASDANLITASVSMDLSAAFDCVEHETLLNKLRFYGIDGNELQWISSYLSCRSFYVSIGSTQSKILPAPHGVPQGSVMGPILYLLYVNEMTSVINDDNCTNNVHAQSEQLFTRNCNNCGILPMYADDGQFLTSSNSRTKNQARIEHCFWTIRDFLNANGLQVNECKTTLSEIMTHQKRAKIQGVPPVLEVQELVKNNDGTETLEDKIITDKKVTRMLGLNIQNNLLWEGHLTSGKKAVLPGVRRQIGLISKLARNMSFKARLHLTNSLVISRLTYMICIWGNTTPNYITRAQVVLNAAARVVTQRDKFTSQKILMKECGWLTIRELTIYHSLTQLWKTVWWHIPGHLDDRITRTDDNTLITANPRLQITLKGYRQQSVLNWNSLPIQLRTEKNITRFKKGIKNWLADLRIQTTLDDSQPSSRPPDN